MSERILTFQTVDADHVSEWAFADALSHRMANELEARGYVINFETCEYTGMQDWEFLARRDGEEFVVVLVIFGVRPTRWFVSLDDTHCKQLESPAIEAVILPVLESVIAAWPGASCLRWHADYSTLRDV